MIHLSRQEAALICGIVLVFAAGNLIYACREPRLEYVPGRVKAGWKTIETDPEQAAPTAPEASVDQ